MATRLIAYDLNRPVQEYDDLIEAIKSLGPWWHHLDSTWLVKSTLSVTEIRNQLGRIIDSDDELLVVDVTDDARAWRGFTERGATWLKETWK